MLSAAQVFELAEAIGRRPVGNVRQLPSGSYRLRFRRDGEALTSPEVYASRAEAQRALWAMAGEGQADCHQDRRYRALVLLATFASLRWGEAAALRRCDVNLEAGTVRVRFTLVERSSGEALLGPPKSRASRRVVGIPSVIIPALREHRDGYVGADSAAWFFPGAKGGPLRRGNFNKMSGWPEVVRLLGFDGLHFHDLRHTGNQFAANSGVGLRDLMARMGHDSERVALIYQHEAQGADRRIADAIDRLVQADRHDDDGDDGSAGVLVPAG